MSMETLGQRRTGASDAPRRTRLFQNGNNQAVRIPKALAFDSVGVDVEIERRGEEMIVWPTRRKLTGLGAAFRKLRPRFRGYRRDQPVQDERGLPPAALPEPRTGRS